MTQLTGEIAAPSAPAALPSALRLGLARGGLELRQFFRQRAAVVFVFALPAILFTLFASIFHDHLPAGVTVRQLYLGGMIAGVLWVKLGWHQDYVQLPWEGLGAKLKRLFGGSGQKRELVGAAAPRKRRESGFTVDPVAPKPEKDFISEDVDPILEKISAHGIHSLTETERKTLEAARKKMSRR